MNIIAIVVKTVILLFGVTAICWSDNIGLHWKIILSMIFIIFVLFSAVIDHVQLQRNEQIQANITNQIQTLTSEVKEDTAQAKKIAEIENRPYVRLETKAIRFDPVGKSFIFPVKNYGRGIAKYVTIKFDSDQLLNHSEISIEDLPPDGKAHQFFVRTCLPVSPESEIGKQYRKLFADINSDKKALVFTVSGYYKWNETRYEIPNRYGVLTKNVLHITLSEDATSTAEDTKKSNVEPIDLQDNS